MEKMEGIKRQWDEHDKPSQFKPFCPEYITGQRLLSAPASSCCQHLLTSKASAPSVPGLGSRRSGYNGLCHLQNLVTLQFPRAPGSCRRAGCKHRAAQLSSRDPSTRAQSQQQDKEMWEHIPVTPVSPRAHRHAGCLGAASATFRAAKGAAGHGVTQRSALHPSRGKLADRSS